MIRSSPQLAVATMTLVVLTSIATVAAQSTPARSLALDITIKGQDAFTLRAPIGLAFASDEELGVIDTHGSRLIVFRLVDGAWQAVRSLELEQAPYDIARLDDRYLVSLRADGGLVAVEDPQFQMRKLRLPGGCMPGAIAAARDGGYWVADLAVDRVLLFGAAGGEPRSFAVPPGATRLAASAAGGFYAAYPAEGLLRRYGADGSLLSEWELAGDAPTPAWPDGIVAEARGSLLVVDRHGGRILELDPGGRWIGVGAREGWDAGLLRFPAGLAAMPDGRIAVADEGNGRVQIFKRLGGS